jgi:hypothetical protein
VRTLVLLLALSTVASAEPVLEMGQPGVTGTPNEERLAQLHAVVAKHEQDYLKCYSQVLAKLDPDATLGGRMHVTLIVRVDGKTTGAAAVGVDEKVSTCVQAIAKQLRFAKQPEKTQIDYTFTFSPQPPPEAGSFASLTGTGDISSGFDDSNIYGGLLGNEAGDGSGWGTIGTSRYGTIGSGSGSGYGRGGLRGRSSPVPTVSVGQPQATGDLDKAIIRRYIKRNIQKLEYCYEKQLLAKPTLKGTVTATFEIASSGLVTSSTAEGVDPEVSECIAAVIKDIEFPKPKGGGVVEVKYPLTFRPADDAPAAKKPKQ